MGACGGALALLLGSAAAATASTEGDVVAVPLAPAADVVSSLVLPVENLPGLELTDVVGTDAYTAVPLDPGGEVRITLPEGLEVPDPSAVTLRMADIDDPPLDGSESLTFTADGSSALTAEAVDGELVVVVPPEADLALEDETEGVLTYPVAGDVPGLAAEEAFYDLDLGTDVAAPSVDLAPVLLTTSYLEAPAVQAGGSLELSLPDGSPLREAGVRSLEDVVVVLDDLGRDEAPPSPTVAASEDAVLVSLGASTAPGDYRAAVLLPVADGTGAVLAQRASATSLLFEVTAAPAPSPSPEPTGQPTTPPTVQPTTAPTRPAANPGLRSNTGVEAATDGSDRDALLVGGGAALVAAAGATVLATRRRSAR
ncbi:hypothetical protein [uncultured Pseudokineococcus sp.]|uniref:hypothetical protein n=1 Tax=uncultured Pseudokineococcus sp. TaxID=1642928 RepID=UPI00261675BA|nr:hypothetical protein [uncultured Pseudokineococcus sp.]